MRTNLVRLAGFAAGVLIGDTIASYLIARTRHGAEVPGVDATAIDGTDIVLGSHWYAKQPTPELDHRLAELRTAFTAIVRGIQEKQGEDGD